MALDRHPELGIAVALEGTDFNFPNFSEEAISLLSNQNAPADNRPANIAPEPRVDVGPVRQKPTIASMLNPVAIVNEQQDIVSCRFDKKKATY